MSDVGTEEHDLSQPFTGGAFDILVEVFQNNLIKRGLISEELGRRSFNAHTVDLSGIQEEFNQFYQGKETEFKEALLDARDYFGKLMAKAWSNTSCDYLSYAKVLNNIIKADEELSEGKYKQTILDCFNWREIVPATEDNRTILSTHLVTELTEDNQLVSV
ncbi:hypothetical protein [Clostridium sp. UBA1056]|uniref:hypothetical protein n=1 Tax=unclassified Clostridium TaxID=2614128 RepID=UPI003217804E